MRLAVRLSCPVFRPALKAVPAELICGADLIRKAVRVHPPLLFGPPAAIPGELEHTGLTGAFHHDGPDEVGATGAGVYVKTLDRPLGVRVQQVVDEADHLDARHVPGEGDRGGLRSRGEGDDIGLEALAGAGAREDLGVDWHGRNISKRGGFSDGDLVRRRTKLTAGSAHACHA